MSLPAVRRDSCRVYEKGIASFQMELIEQSTSEAEESEGEESGEQTVRSSI